MTGNRKAALVIGAAVVAIAAVYFLTPTNATAIADAVAGDPTTPGQDPAVVRQIVSRLIAIRDRVLAASTAATASSRATTGYTELAT